MLKKSFFITMLILTMCITGYGFEKGTMSLGGSFSFSATKSSDDSPTNTGLWIYPSASYFFKDNICLDTSLGFGVGWTKGLDTQYSYSLEIGSRYFYKMFYGGFKFDFDRYGSKGYMSNRKYLILRIGRLLSLAKNLYFDFSINYEIGLGNIRRGNSFVDNDSKELSARIGVSYFFKL